MDKPRIEDSKVQRRRRTEKDGCFRKLDRKRVFASNGTAVGDGAVNGTFVGRRDVTADV